MQVKIIKPVSDKPEIAKHHPVGEIRKGRLVGGGKHVAIFHMMRGSFGGSRRISKWYPIDCFEIIPDAAKPEMGKASRELLNNAFAGVRAAYVARYIELEMARLEIVRKDLAAVGMDANVYAPFPSGNMSRAAYRQAENKYRMVRAWFAEVKSCRGMHEPAIVIERPETEGKLKAEATRAANALVDAFLAKMAGKIGADITAAECNGLIWDGAVLKVTTAAGEAQVWETKCILNVSCLGKVFNQWPTRRR